MTEGRTVGRSARDLVRELLGERAAAYRSQVEFAETLGLDPAYLNRLLSGKTEVGPRMARRLVRHFPEMRGVLADALLEVA